MLVPHGLDAFFDETRAPLGHRSDGPDGTPELSFFEKHLLFLYFAEMECPYHWWSLEEIESLFKVEPPPGHGMSRANLRRAYASTVPPKRRGRPTDPSHFAVWCGAVLVFRAAGSSEYPSDEDLRDLGILAGVDANAAAWRDWRRRHLARLRAAEAEPT